MSADEEAGPWLYHVEWEELVAQSLEQLRVARAAILYLVRTVEANEARTAALDRERGLARGTLPLLRMDSEYNELDLYAAGPLAAPARVQKLCGA
jgi:hypothetical protein